MILKSAAGHQAHREEKHECASETVTTSAHGDAAAQRAPRRVPIVELNEHLTCFICKGYFVDATTIIECLHSFCRSCIVKYLESNKYCPVCDVQVHKTKPLLNIRPDKTLQDIVYKLVPKLFQNETQKRHNFYAQHSESKPSALETRSETTYQHLLTPDEMLCISLIYNGASEKCTPRYLRCSAAVSMFHLQKLIRNKYDLSAHHRVEILHQEDSLASYLTLMDVAYIYLWRRKVPLALTYRIYENKRTSLHMPSHNSSSENNNNDSSGEEGWKEVQLRISENGEMSVTGIQDCLSLLDANILEDDKNEQDNNEKIIKGNKGKDKGKESAKIDVVKGSPSKKLKLEKDKKTYLSAKDKISKDPKRETRSALQVKNNAADLSKNKAIEKIEPPNVQNTKTGKILPKDRKRKSLETSEDKEKKEKEDVGSKKSKLDELQSTLPACISITTKPASAAPPAPPAPPAPAVILNHSLGTKLPPPPVVLNHSLGLQNLSNNHPLKKHSLGTKSAITSPVVSLNSMTTVSPSTASNHTRTLSKLHQKQLTTITTHVQTQPPVDSVTPSTLKVSTVSSSSTVKSTAANSLCTATTSSTYTSSPSLGKNLRENYGQYPRSGGYTPPSTNYTPINVPSVRHYMPPGQPQPQPQPRFKNDLPGLKQWRPEVKPPGGASPHPGSTNDLRNVRPAKFFKMRNNMPRYLGCPASGVKPMYPVQVPDSPEKIEDKEKDRDRDRDMDKDKDRDKEREKNTPKSVKDLAKNLNSCKDRDSKDPKDSKEKSQVKKDEKQKQSAVGTSCTEIKRHSIVKIDPKTLKPIAERAPELTSLTCSNYTPSPQDLKINTSSVSIFNPIKLQSERKSPHSPISKRPASSPTTAGNLPPTQNQGQGQQTNATPPNSGIGLGVGGPMGMLHQNVPKHQKVPGNLSYTPPNPFVPNLQAPTMNPNQFMYPSAAGFPYDPMMVAFLAYSRNYDFHKMQMGQMGQMGQMPFGVQPLVMMSSPQGQGQGQPQLQSLQQSPSSTGKKKEAKDNNKEKSTSSSRTSSPKVDRVDRIERTESPKNITKDDINTKDVVLKKDVKETRNNQTSSGSTTTKPCKSEKSLQNALDKLTKAKMVGDKMDADVVEKPTKTKNKIEIKSQITITSQGNVSHAMPVSINENKQKQTNSSMSNSKLIETKTKTNEPQESNEKVVEKQDKQEVKEITPTKSTEIGKSPSREEEIKTSDKNAEVSSLVSVVEETKTELKTNACEDKKEESNKVEEASMTTIATDVTLNDKVVDDREEKQGQEIKAEKLTDSAVNQEAKESSASETPIVKNEVDAPKVTSDNSKNEKEKAKAKCTLN